MLTEDLYLKFINVDTYSHKSLKLSRISSTLLWDNFVFASLELLSVKCNSEKWIFKSYPHKDCSSNQDSFDCISFRRISRNLSQFFICEFHKFYHFLFIANEMWIEKRIIYKHKD